MIPSQPLLLSLILACSTIASDDEPRTLGDYSHLADGKLILNANLPNNPLTRDKVAQWAAVLNASDAQLEFMLLEYQHFLTKHNALLDREAPAHVARGVEMGDVWLNEGPNTEVALDLVREIDRHNVRLRRKLIEIEHTFIRALLPILTPEQQQRLFLLEHEASRRNCRTFFKQTSRAARWAAVELRELWNVSAFSLASPSERLRVDTILAEYERQLTPLVCNHADIIISLRYDLTKNRIARERGLVSPDEGRDRYARLMSRNLEMVQRIRSLTERTIRHVAEAVSDAIAEEFLTAARQRIYPELYPDPFRLHETFQAVLDDESLDSKQLQNIAGLFAGYEQQYQQASEAMETKIIEWYDNFGAGINGYQPQFLPDALKPMLDERRGLARRYLDKLHVHLDPELLSQHAEAILQSLDSEETEISEYEQ